MNANTGECETHADGKRSALSFVFFLYILYITTSLISVYLIQFIVHPFIANSDIVNIFSLALPSQLSIYFNFNFNVFISIAPFTKELSLSALQSPKPRA